VNPNAALYLRSSKDRSDVSIDAQRRALHDLAASRGLVVVEEFADAVESGKDDDRPAFQSLLAALRDPRRAWSTVLVFDTSRVARRRALALLFEQECEKRAVGIVYRSVPEGDPITDTLLRAILQAIDEWHSLVSKAKGLLGMEENVRQGWRAGGRAPRGYSLQTIATGAIRDGEPVTKSKLVPNEDAPLVAAYLRARAAGEPRRRAAERLLPGVAITSLHGLEWNALTYAGATVWRQHAERVSKGKGYAGGGKIRPRAEWVVQEGTHEPLVTRDEAEAILAGMARQRERTTRDRGAGYLLTGLLVAPDGQAWTGDQGGFYRHGQRGRRVASRRVDEAVLGRLRSDLAAPETVERVIRSLRALDGPPDGRSAAALRKRIEGLDAKLARLVDLASDESVRAPVLRRVADLERERSELRATLAEMERETAQAAAVADVTPEAVRAALGTLLDDLVAADGGAAARPLLGELLERVELDPDTLGARMHYRLEGGISVASRRRSELIPPPAVRWVVEVALPGRRPGAGPAG
jgi:site-specific DNA recombinase